MLLEEIERFRKLTEREMRKKEKEGALNSS